MTLERLDGSDRRRIAVCALVAAASLFVGVRYFFRAFPEASIDFRVTRESSRPVAEAFLAGRGLAPAAYRHAAVFGFDDDAKTFLEREVGVGETARLLDSSVRLWRWKHRWFRPIEREEMAVEVTTRGEVAGFRHVLPEEAPGDRLPAEEARARAERFLAETMVRPLATVEYVEGTTEQRPNRTDYSFTWKLRGSEVKGGDVRIAVGVAGGNVASYSEWLRVPDTWTRDYRRLRSRNEVTGLADAVLLVLTVVAMIVLFARRVRRGDVHWRPAVVLGGITGALAAASSLNQIPAELYAYDTTTSFASFVMKAVFGALGAGLAWAVTVFLLAAAAEPLYRERFPRALSLASLVRARALRTKEFFTACLVGVTLTCFFFAYENVFYIVANRLGAWSPREVPYSDLLSTAVPWVFVLFFGWFPALTEELSSRVFSIPFLERVLRSRAGAVVVAAFVWGFGHAAYPNQPFWIRGLEVGLAGIVFGVVFLRYGILAVVACHFSVDALYTAFLLLRSGSPYLIVSGALAAGLFVVLLAAAAIAYAVRGGFLPAERTNQAEGVAPEPPRPRAAEGPAVDYVPLSRRAVAWALAAAALLAALALVPTSYFGDWVDFRTTRREARARAEEFLKGLGLDVSADRASVTVLDRTDETAAAYALETGGPEAARAFYADLVPTPLWRVRFFQGGRHEETAVSIDPARGDALGFTRTLPEDAPGATVPAEEARAIAERFLREHGVDPGRGELKEQSQKDEKARRDHTLVWELPGPEPAGSRAALEAQGRPGDTLAPVTPAGSEPARVRFEVVVQGDRVGSWTREVKIPEEWRLARERQTVLLTLRRWLKLPLFVLLVVYAVQVLIPKTRAGEVPWRLAIGTGAVVAAVVLANGALATDRLWSAYKTWMPLTTYRVTMAISLGIGAVLAALGGTFLGAVAGAVHPTLPGTLGGRARPRYARDALVAGLAVLGLVLGREAIVRLLHLAVPTPLAVVAVPVPPGVESTLPAASVLAGAATQAVLLGGLAAVVTGLLRDRVRSTGARVALAAVTVVAFLPGDARRPAELAVAALAVGLLLAGLVLVGRLVLRDNPLAWLWSAFLVTGVRGATALLGQGAPLLRAHGAAALVVLLAAGGLLLRDALGSYPGRSGEKT